MKDNGPGISDNYHDKIFELFQRLQTDQRGTGVGLAIVKRVTEVHGGRVWVESEPGHGATFRVAFPRSLVRMNAELHEDIVEAPRSTS